MKGTAWAEMQRPRLAGMAVTKSMFWVGSKFEKLGVHPGYGGYLEGFEF